MKAAFCKKIFLFCCLISGICASAQETKLVRASFDNINLNYPGLEPVKQLVNDGKFDQAAIRLLAYYRNRRAVRHPDYNPEDKAKHFGKPLPVATQESADQALKHIFKPHKSYPSFDYGTDINWKFDPKSPGMDLRRSLHDQPWFIHMGLAYWASGDEKYAKEWVFQFADWVAENQPGDAENDRYAWNAFETGARVQKWTSLFQIFLRSPHFTPSFLLTFLNAIHANAEFVSTHYSSEGNHGLYEAVNMMYAGNTFPEMKKGASWKKGGVDKLVKEIQRQVYPDGMNYELSMSYHNFTIGLFLTALKVARLSGTESDFPNLYYDRIEKMILSTINFSFPDYTWPLFGDSFLSDKSGMLRSYYPAWMESFPDNKIIKYFGTDGKQGHLPDYLSKALPSGGIYTFRNSWKKDATVMVLKAGPPAFYHSQPDNGTFELWVKGRNFTPDAGSFAYGSNDSEPRRWYRQTCVHQTLTLDNQNITNKAKQHKWETSENLDVLTYENPSYTELGHRRSILFINRKYFLIIDKAFGKANGKLGTHFVLRENSQPVFDKINNSVYTNYPDGNNLLIQNLNQDKVSLKEEEGKVSYVFTNEISRPAFVFEKPKSSAAAQVFVAIAYPFDGSKAPDISIAENAGNDYDNGHINLTLTINGEKRHIQTEL